MNRVFNFERFVKNAEAGGFPVILGWSAQERLWCIAVPDAGEVVVGRGKDPSEATDDLVNKLKSRGGKS